MILRERDANTAWASAADGTLEERLYYAQNWRADVVAIVNSTGKLVERARYSSYGIPTAFPAGDTDFDGDWDATDSADIGSNYTPGSAYAVRRDTDLDGDVDANDVTHANSITGGYQTLGRDVLTSAAVRNRIGYAGYQYDTTFAGVDRHLYHVRHRVYDAEAGRWTRRDPLGYVDGMGLYDYVQSAPIAYRDGAGTLRTVCSTSQECFTSTCAGFPPAPTLPVPYPFHPLGHDDRTAWCQGLAAWTAATLGMQIDDPCWDRTFNAFYFCCMNQPSPPNMQSCALKAHEAFTDCYLSTTPYPCWIAKAAYDAALQNWRAAAIAVVACALLPPPGDIVCWAVASATLIAAKAQLQAACAALHACERWNGFPLYLCDDGGTPLPPPGVTPMPPGSPMLPGPPGVQPPPLRSRALY